MGFIPLVFQSYRNSFFTQVSQMENLSIQCFSALDIQPKKNAPLRCGVSNDLSYQSLLYTFDSKRKISIYNQTMVTSNPNAPNHSM